MGVHKCTDCDCVLKSDSKPHNCIRYLKNQMKYLYDFNKSKIESLSEMVITLRSKILTLEEQYNDMKLPYDLDNESVISTDSSQTIKTQVSLPRYLFKQLSDTTTDSGIDVSNIGITNESFNLNEISANGLVKTMSSESIDTLPEDLSATHSSTPIKSNGSPERVRDEVKTNESMDSSVNRMTTNSSPKNETIVSISEDSVKPLDSTTDETNRAPNEELNPTLNSTPIPLKRRIKIQDLKTHSVDSIPNELSEFIAKQMSANSSVTTATTEPNISSPEEQVNQSSNEKAVEGIVAMTSDKTTSAMATSSSNNELSELEAEELVRRIKEILDSLVPQNFEELLNQILSLKLDTDRRLKIVLDLVYEKVVDRHHLCFLYANLCKSLSIFKNSPNNTNRYDIEGEVKFKRILLHKCQKEFEADIYAPIVDLEERKEEINKCTVELKKNYLTKVLDEDLRKTRKRSYGKMKLMVEFYKLSMLKIDIILRCFQCLIDMGDNESLDCLGDISTAIGEKLESEAKKSFKVYLLDNIYNSIETIAYDSDDDVKEPSIRVRYKLKNVVEMRKNNWKTKRCAAVYTYK